MALEDWFGDIDSYRTHNTVANVAILLVLAEELLNGARYRLAESHLVRTALNSVLTIDEGVILLARLIGMSERNLYILALEVNDRIEWLHGHIVGEQVK